MLNQNYTPTKLVSTENMSETDWLNWRKNGLGGSDASIVMGCSPYRTKRDLYYDKAGIPNALPDDNNWVAKKIGHLLEGLVAELFTQRMGYKTWEEKYMYQHPLYPFMLANVDRFVELPNGAKGILEIKTSHYQNKDKWANGTIPRHYELQCRFYMAVMNLDFCYIVCLFSNSDSDLVMRFIERDLDEEEILINELKNFWHNYVLAKVEPPLTETGDLLLDTLGRHYGSGDTQIPEINLPIDCLEPLLQYLEIKERKAALDKESRQLEKQIKTAYAPIVDQMGYGTHALLMAGDTHYHITFAPSYKTTLNKEQCDLLELKYPDIYSELSITTESRPFKVSVTSAKKATA